jgi:hypothetical protein
MRVKFNRGPNKGVYRDMPDDTYEIRVAAVEPIQWDAYSDIPITAPIRKIGTYYKSNVTLKDGTRVFEWMGWCS